MTKRWQSEENALNVEIRNFSSRECPKLSKNNYQRCPSLEGSWSNSNKEKVEVGYEHSLKSDEWIEDFTFSNSMTGLPKDFTFKARSLEDVKKTHYRQ
ncbi:hypothetical protein Tco_0909412, partial [Tanacetum coccineum]